MIGLEAEKKEALALTEEEIRKRSGGSVWRVHGRARMLWPWSARAPCRNWTSEETFWRDARGAGGGNERELMSWD
jgi:hypothetical protein